MKTSPRVVFAGAYGLRSQGDDAALVVIADALRSRHPLLQATVIARHAHEDLYSRYGIRSVPNFEYERKEDSLEKWFRGFNFSDDRSDLTALQRTIARSDLLVIGAGNALVDYTIDLLRGPIPYFFLLTLMAELAGTPVMWFGLSVGPFRTAYGRRLTRLMGQRSDVITVRDEQSVQELRRLGLAKKAVLLPDPVLGLSPEPGDRSVHPVKRQAHASGRPVVAVAPRAINERELTLPEYLERHAAICDALIDTAGVSLLFVPQCTYSHGNPMEDDRAVIEAIVQRMTNRQAAFCVSDHLSVQETLALYADCDASLCTRLHGSVCSAIQAVPMVAVDYNPKVAGFMSSMGCSEQVVGLRQFDVPAVTSRLSGILKNRATLATQLQRRTIGARGKIQQYADLASSCLTTRSERT